MHFVMFVGLYVYLFTCLYILLLTSSIGTVFYKVLTNVHGATELTGKTGQALEGERESLRELQRLKEEGIDLPPYFLHRTLWSGYGYTKNGPLSIESCFSLGL